MVRSHAGSIHVRRKAPSTVLISLHACQAVAAGFATKRGDRHERQREADAGFTGGAAEGVSAGDLNPRECRKARRFASATFTRVFSAETSVKRTRAVDRDAGRLRSCD